MMTKQGKIISVNVCTEPGTTGIYKKPQLGKVGVYERQGSFYLQGDLVQNRRFHGGPDRSLCCYSHEYYPRWYDGKLDQTYELGLVGENLTTEGLTDDKVFLGDIFQIGGLTVTITCNRGPCNTLAKRLGRPEAPKRMLEALEMGFYLRLLEVGEVEAGDEILLHERMPGGTRVSIKEYATTKYFDKKNKVMLERILSCPRLGVDDREEFEELLRKA